jgi:hypothetical protein
MTHDVPFAGHLDDHSLALEYLQRPGGHAVRDVVMLGDRVNRGDPSGHGPLRDLVSQHLRDLLIGRHRRVRVDHTASIPGDGTVGKDSRSAHGRRDAAGAQGGLGPVAR